MRIVMSRQKSPGDNITLAFFFLVSESVFPGVIFTTTLESLKLFSAIPTDSNLAFHLFLFFLFFFFDTIIVWSSLISLMQSTGLCTVLGNYLTTF